MSLEEVEKKLAIRDVIDRFSNLEINVSAQAELFTADTKINIYSGDQKVLEINGREDMKQKFGAAMANATSSYHMNGQQVVDLNDDGTATDTHYCQATIINEQNGQKVMNTSSIRYIDTLVNQDGKWLISNREQYIVLSEQRTINN